MRARGAPDRTAPSRRGALRGAYILRAHAGSHHLLAFSVLHLPVWEFSGNQDDSPNESKVVWNTNTIPLWS
eukprot:2212940-Prymnesium_polylepis.1